MKTYKTTINCAGCVAKITPVLDANPEISEWSVDVKDPKKVLSVKSDTLSSNQIIEIITQSGFKIEEINN